MGAEGSSKLGTTSPLQSTFFEDPPLAWRCSRPWGFRDDYQGGSAIRVQGEGALLGAPLSMNCPIHPTWGLLMLTEYQTLY